MLLFNQQKVPQSYLIVYLFKFLIFLRIVTVANQIGAMNLYMAYLTFNNLKINRNAGRYCADEDYIEVLQGYLYLFNNIYSHHNII